MKQYDRVTKTFVKQITENKKALRSYATQICKKRKSFNPARTHGRFLFNFTTHSDAVPVECQD
jgi:hypothetical protein